ncbi:YlqD family protein [Mangrovibacillus cuniculi]|uniref:YlqD protein n=1 Tax=Mangrovibacillus cuniculi TaxID=2593652 RepID=A0A7S8CAB4_9BACI|nr:YlqD family protein [Mangrovibacillus cuniculi]QPC46321.1 hypothetical protein G8O30_04765 [Mangrovibacillus cuniculi]
MKIKKQVIVYEIVTAEMKKEKETALKKIQYQLELEISQMQFELRKWRKKHGAEKWPLQPLFNEKTTEHGSVVFQLQQLELVPLGTKIKSEELETWIEVQVGQSIDHLREPDSVIVENGIIIDIQQR